MIGEKIGPYRIEAKLGSGGYGVVYRAVDTRLRRPVALKFLRPRGDGPERLWQRFLREARAMASVNHPNVLTIHEIRRAGDDLVICAELVEGEDLERRLVDGPLTPFETAELGLALLDALEALHARGILHRDLKPANVMIADDGLVKLMDFGIAVGGDLERVTGEGSVSGTVGYMSPEQLRGQDLDAASDLFSLGAVLYESASGRKAFDGDSASECVAATLTARPKSIDSRATGLPPRLARAILACLEKSPGDRPDPSTLRTELEAAKEEARAAARSRTDRRRRPTPAQAIAAAAAATLIVTASLALASRLLERGRDPDRTVTATGPESGASSVDASSVDASSVDAAVYRYTVEGDPSTPGGWREIGSVRLADGAVVTPEDRLGCRVRARRDAHVYVFYRDSEGAWVTLYPAGAENEPANPHAAGTELRLPVDGYLRPSGRPGTERLWFVALDESSPELEAALARLPTPYDPERAHDPDALASGDAVRELREIVIRGLSLETADSEPSSPPDDPLALLNRIGARGQSVERTLRHVRGEPTDPGR